MSSWKITDPDRTIRYACQMYQRWVFTPNTCRFAQRTIYSTNDMVQNLKRPVSFIFVFASHLSLHLIAHHMCHVGCLHQRWCDAQQAPSVPVFVHLLLLIADLALASLSLATWLVLSRTSLRYLSFQHYDNFKSLPTRFFQPN